MAINEHDVTALVKKTANGVRYCYMLRCRWFYGGYKLQHHAPRHAVHHIVQLYKTERETIFSHEKKGLFQHVSSLTLSFFNRYGLHLVPSPHSPTSSPPTIIRLYHFVFTVSISIRYYGKKNAYIESQISPKIPLTLPKRRCYTCIKAFTPTR